MAEAACSTARTMLKCSQGLRLCCWGGRGGGTKTHGTTVAHGYWNAQGF